MSAERIETAPEREIKATLRMAAWTIGWVLSLALAKFGPGSLWPADAAVASWAAVALNVAVGIGWIASFTVMLRTLDELQRKIMQDALAATLGAIWIAGFAYVVADGLGLVSAGEYLAVLVPAFMTAVFFTAYVVGRIRYR